MSTTNGTADLLAPRDLTSTALPSRYTLQDCIGTGTQGRVWLAFDGVEGCQVAVKCVPAGTDWDNARREVLLLRTLAVPGVVRLHDEWVSADGWWLVMEYLVGHPFPGPLQGNRPGILTATALIARTLETLHARGVVHSDLKPANVLVDTNGPTLLDFGFAIDTSAAQSSGGFTPRYAAPELLWGATPSPAADLHALGAMAAEALGGTLSREPGGTVRVAWREASDPTGRAMLEGMLAPRMEDRPTAIEVARGLGATGPPMPDRLEHAFAPSHPFDHSTEDALELLRARIEDGADLAGELARWAAAGCGHWESGRLVIGPSEVGRLRLAWRQGLDALPPSWSQPSETRLDESLDWAADQLHALDTRQWLPPLLDWCSRRARQLGDGAKEERTLALWTAFALHSEDETRLHEARLACDRSERGTHLGRLLRIGLQSRFRRRFEGVEPLPDLEDLPDLPCMHIAVQLVLTWTLRHDSEALLAFLEGPCRAWATVPERAAWHARWLGLVAYQRGDYRAALEAWEQLGSEARLGDHINRATALLELGEPEQAAAIAARSRPEAARLRQPILEAHATWLTRHARYRAHRPQSCRPDYAEGVAPLGAELEGMFALSEAAIAWRGNHAGADGLADRAQRAFRARGRQGPALVAKALGCVLRRDAAEASAQVAAVRQAGPGDFTAQALGLLARAGARVDPSWTNPLRGGSQVEKLCLPGGGGGRPSVMGAAGVGRR